MARRVTAPIVRVGKKKKGLLTKCHFVLVNVLSFQASEFFRPWLLYFYLFTQLFSRLILGERDSLAINE